MGPGASFCRCRQMAGGFCLVAADVSEASGLEGQSRESAQTLAEVLEFEKSLDLKIEARLSLRVAATGRGQHQQRIPCAGLGRFRTCSQRSVKRRGVSCSRNSGDRRRNVCQIRCRSCARRVANRVAQDSSDETARALGAEERLLALGSVALSGLRRHLFTN